MDILINVVLPISLALIMLSLGIGLTIQDFTRVARAPKAFAIGALCQTILVPLTAYAVAKSFGITGALAVGVMLLSLCPGGVTSNMICKLARGDVALSVSLTAVISLLSILTVPILAAWSVSHFMGTQGPEVSVTSLALAMFVITTLPVLIGVIIRHFTTPFANRVEPILSKLATALFALIVVAALVGNWALFVEIFPTLGPALITLNTLLMLFGFLLAGAIGLAAQSRKTISIETGVQNATLGITMAAIISGQSDGFSTMALPSAAYGITMYLVAIPFVIWFRSK